jgi:hypothetical protein
LIVLVLVLVLDPCLWLSAFTRRVDDEDEHEDEDD